MKSLVETIRCFRALDEVGIGGPNPPEASPSERAKELELAHAKQPRKKRTPPPPLPRRPLKTASGHKAPSGPAHKVPVGRLTPKVPVARLIKVHPGTPAKRPVTRGRSPKKS